MEQLDGLEKNDFCDFEKPPKRACQKGKNEFNEQSKEVGFVLPGERMPERQWLRSDRKAENPGIRKEEDELRLDS